MKLYEKIIDGQQYIMPANKIVVIKDEMQVFNPTEEMLLLDGWNIYVQNFVEPSEEEILHHAIESITNDIIEYDSSDNVNLFYLNDIPMWLDRETRRSLMGRLEAENRKGKTNTCLWYGNHKFEYPTQTAMDMLDTLEIYASECYDVTQFHIANVANINNIEELKNYDYTQGYPEKLRF